MTSSRGQRLGRVTSLALLIAAGCGIAIVAAGFLAPAYDTMSASSSVGATRGSNTLVGVNGLRVVPVLGVPLLATVFVAGALWLRSWRGAVPLAWTITGLLAAFNVVALLSIGVFVVPVTAALIVACSQPRPRRDAAAPPAMVS
jgi:hypothetical protein